MTTAAVTLTDQQRACLLSILSAHAPPIERVDVHGSRALGTSRPGSDIDLVLAGPIDRTTMLRIAGELDESYLSISADVAAYELLEQGPFRDRVIATAVTLFDEDLLRTGPNAWGRGA